MANLLRSRTTEQKRARQIREAGKKTQYLCVGGPWDGQKIWLSDDGDKKTAVLSASGQVGQYTAFGERTPDGEVEWVAVPC